MRKVWNRFFFEPISPATIGLFRIVFGIIIFLAVLGRYPFRELFYGDHGIVRPETTAQFFPGNPLLYFKWMPGSDPWLKFYFWAILTSVISLILGFCTRLSSVLVFLGLISLSNRNFFIDNAGDDLMRINCFFLMFSQAGRAFSIDRLIRIKRGLDGANLTPSGPWAQRLIQLQVAYLYLDTFILKLPGEGWRDGTAIYYALHYIELRRFDFKWFFHYLWQIKLATYGVMAGELALCTLIWFRKFRYWVMAIGFGLHFGINLAMQFPIFQYVMITSLFVFIYPEDIESNFARIKTYASHRWPLKWLNE